MLVGILALLPASAQTMQRLGGQATQLSGAQTMQLSATSFAVDRPTPVSRSDLSTPTQSHAGRFAAAVFRVLASQNTIDVDGPSPPEMDAVLRPPEIGGSGTAVSLFNTAKKLYDTATSYRTESAVVTVDPLGLKCRLSVNLGKLGSK